MDPRAFIAPLYAALIFLFPLGLYFLLLAHVNRTRRPLVLSGFWEGVALLFGLSGFFLYLVPSLISTLYQRSLGAADHLTFDALWQRFSLIWLSYYALLASGAGLLLTKRRHKTAVYNVDPELFGGCLSAALAREGLQAAARGERLELRSIQVGAAETSGAFSEKPSTLFDDRPPIAEVELEVFASLAHVTLHWVHYEPAVRRAVEKQLDAALEHATAQDNPSAAWFLGTSGLIFGMIILLTAFALGLGLFGRR